MGRVALVTGANRGIGRAIAIGLRDAGLDVIIGARRAEDGAQVARELGVRSVGMDLDDTAEMLAATRQLGPVDVLVNNAGILQNTPLLGAGDNFARSMQIMLSAPYELIRTFAPAMQDRRYGRVVNVSSGWGSFASGLGGGGAYAIAKAGLNALTVRAAQELPPFIKVNAIAPGWVNTRMGGDNAPRSPEQGADTAIWLATLPEDGPTGGFFRDRQSVPW